MAMDQESSPDETVQGGQEDEIPGEPEDSAERTAAEQPNPFWSERATEEFRLRQARPLGLAEYDDQLLEPDYAASETARSGGFRSLEAASIRAQSPHLQGSERQQAENSQGRVSSGVPSVSSRSRSPAREDYATMRELLMSFGGAIASLAEEQRHTQQRLARVEETRSGSNSSMRTGREDNESGNARVGDLGVGPQFYEIGEEEIDEPRGLRSGMLPIEDWVQEPTRLSDLPLEPSLFPVGFPQSYGPGTIQGAELFGLGSSRDPLALGAGGKGSELAQVEAGPHCVESSAQARSGGSIGPGQGRSAFGPGAQGFEASAQSGSGGSIGPGQGRSAFGPASKVSRLRHSQVREVRSAQVKVARHLARGVKVSRLRHSQVWEVRSAQVKAARHSAQVPEVSRLQRNQVREVRSAQVKVARHSVLSAQVKVARHSAQVSQVFEVSAQAGLGNAGPSHSQSAFGPGIPGFEALAHGVLGSSQPGQGSTGHVSFGPGHSGFEAINFGGSSGHPSSYGNQGPIVQAQWPSSAGFNVASDDACATGHSFTVWVDGLPRIAVLGPSGLEVRASGTLEAHSPFVNQGRHPFMLGQGDTPRPPPFPPPLCKSHLFGFRP